MGACTPASWLLAVFLPNLSRSNQNLRSSVSGQWGLGFLQRG